MPIIDEAVDISMANFETVCQRTKRFLEGHVFTVATVGTALSQSRRTIPGCALTGNGVYSVSTAGKSFSIHLQCEMGIEGEAVILAQYHEGGLVPIVEFTPRKITFCYPTSGIDWVTVSLEA